MPDWIGKFDDRLALEPPFPDEQLSRIPAKRGVVALLAADDQPILLMTAGDIRARVRTRLREPEEDAPRKTADLRQVTRGVAWRLAGGHFETDLRFLTLARLIWPRRYASMLAWKPAWFVHVNAADKHPHFSPTRKVFASPGRYLGSFGGERSAQRFVDAIQDGFDLCRDHRRLCEAPDAERCTYGQMGRCLSPCDGTISMADYRLAVAKAADFAAGSRDDHRRRLQGRMQAAAAKLRFELAAGIKARVDRLAEIETAEFRHVRPAEQFQFILVQRGRGAGQAKVFLVDRGRIVEPEPLDYPPAPARLEGILTEMRRLAASGLDCGEDERRRIGLVSRYLFSSERRRGLMLHWESGLDAKRLAASIDGARELLSLRKPRKRASKQTKGRRR